MEMLTNYGQMPHSLHPSSYNPSAEKKIRKIFTNEEDAETIPSASTKEVRIINVPRQADNEGESSTEKITTTRRRRSQGEGREGQGYSSRDGNEANVRV
jgi:hypothetical protein